MEICFVLFCFLNDRLLVRYTQKAPQVSTPTLVEAAQNLGKVGTKCCVLPEAQRLPCVEDYVSLKLQYC